jgi:hypothetical protein
VSESGAALTATARLVKTSINRDLTDTGVSEISIPNIGLSNVDDQGAAAPRQWDRKMPFLAQKVIDKGYNLPLPYGIGVTYANVDQEQILRVCKLVSTAAKSYRLTGWRSTTPVPRASR